MVAVKGGEKLQAALAAYAEKRFRNRQVSVGFQNGATEDDGTPVALVAALNEYGVPSHNQPPRPFMRRAINKNDKKWARQFANGMKNTAGDVGRVFALMGEIIATDISQEIIDLKSPPLAESTVQKKGFDKPLIDTHTMLDNVTYEVE